MFKYIISLFLVLSVAMLSCLDDDLRMASVYHPEESTSVEPKVDAQFTSPSYPEYHSLEYSSEHITEELTHNDDLDNSEDETNKVVKELVTKNTSNKKFIAEKNPSALDSNSQENYNYRRVKSTKQSPELFQYKSSVLMRLSAVNSRIAFVGVENPLATSESDELLNQDSSKETSENEVKLLSDDDLIKILDDAPEINTEPLEISKPFNFNLQQQQAVSVSSVDANGEAVAHARFTIENSSGNIIKEGSTDKQGQYSTQLTQFGNNPIYVRFHTIGMNPERVLINPEGGL